MAVGRLQHLAVPAEAELQSLMQLSDTALNISSSWWQCLCPIPTQGQLKRVRAKIVFFFFLP